MSSPASLTAGGSLTPSRSEILRRGGQLESDETSVEIENDEEAEQTSVEVEADEEAEPWPWPVPPDIHDADVRRELESEEWRLAAEEAEAQSRAVDRHLERICADQSEECRGDYRRDLLHRETGRVEPGSETRTIPVHARRDEKQSVMASACASDDEKEDTVASACVADDGKEDAVTTVCASEDETEDIVASAWVPRPSSRVVEDEPVLTAAGMPMRGSAAKFLQNELAAKLQLEDDRQMYFSEDELNEHAGPEDTDLQQGSEASACSPGLPAGAGSYVAGCVARFCGQQSKVTNEYRGYAEDDDDDDEGPPTGGTRGGSFAASACRSSPPAAPPVLTKGLPLKPKRKAAPSCAKRLLSDPIPPWREKSDLAPDPPKKKKWIQTKHGKWIKLRRSDKGRVRPRDTHRWTDPNPTLRTCRKQIKHMMRADYHEALRTGRISKTDEPPPAAMTRKERRELREARAVDKGAPRGRLRSGSSRRSPTSLRDF